MGKGREEWEGLLEGVKEEERAWREGDGRVVTIASTGAVDLAL